MGPSPRVRGILPASEWPAGRARSIPARAGNPRPEWASAGSARVHPRACGESPTPAPAHRSGTGPSPRVRGIPRLRERRAARPGSIPARAGNPAGSRSSPGTSRVHPRACGESGPLPRAQLDVLGPSPRVRGIHRGRGEKRRRDGSIPARAGNPRRSADTPRPRRVHPRACGESPTTARRLDARRGPSPRVRGIPPPVVAPRDVDGSIPARAGNPTCARQRYRRRAVHPRACGESQAEAVARQARRGPSPRVRGIHLAAARRPDDRGSIPARAGNPRRRGIGVDPTRVHPRACGESAPKSLVPPRYAGPSPRVRGIRRSSRPAPKSLGSIPARAGNPEERQGSRGPGGVHPRACGESGPAKRTGCLKRGPSPRVRGIRRCG